MDTIGIQKRNADAGKHRGAWQEREYSNTKLNPADPFSVRMQFWGEDHQVVRATVDEYGRKESTDAQSQQQRKIVGYSICDSACVTVE